MMINLPNIQWKNVQDFFGGVADTIGKVGADAATSLARSKYGTAADTVQKAITKNKTVSETFKDTITGKTNPLDELKTNVKGTVDSIPGAKYLPLILAGGAALVAVSILKK